MALRKNLEKAQNRMRTAANRHRRHLEFNVGDRVLLKLQQYRQHSVARPISAKLARQFYGPFEVLERIGQVAYRLRLPEGSRIHDVFHVSLLRPFVKGSQRETSDFPVVFARGKSIARPTKLLQRRVVWCDGATLEEGQLQWSDDGGAAPTWEPMSLIEKHFPDLLVDKELLNGEGIDTEMIPPPITEAPTGDANDKGKTGVPETEDRAAEFITEEEEGRPVEVRRANDRPRRQPKPVVRYGDFVPR